MVGVGAYRAPVGQAESGDLELEACRQQVGLSLQILSVHRIHPVRVLDTHMGATFPSGKQPNGNTLISLSFSFFFGTVEDVSQEKRSLSFRMRLGHFVDLGKSLTFT